MRINSGLMLTFILSCLYFGLGCEDSKDPVNPDLSQPMPWLSLFEDGNEPPPIDIRDVFVRSSATTISFKVEMNGNWGNPHIWAGGINCAFFLDVDQNPRTGLNPEDSLWYTVPEIGADYMIVVGVGGDSLYVWNDIWAWTSVAGLSNLKLPDSSNTFDFILNLALIDTPAFVDIVIANIGGSESSSEIDWVPDLGEGYATYEIGTESITYHEPVETEFIEMGTSLVNRRFSWTE